MSRKQNEIIDIGDDIQLFVVEIQPDKVRLGFRAPKGVRIDRREVRDRIAKGEPDRRADKFGEDDPAALRQKIADRLNSIERLGYTECSADICDLVGELRLLFAERGTMP